MTKRPAKIQRRKPPPALRYWIAALAVALAGFGYVAYRDSHAAKPRAVALAPAPPPRPRDVQTGSHPAAQPPEPAPSPAQTVAARETPPPEDPTAARAWLVDAFKSCWKPPRGVPDGDPYMPRVRIALERDGSLASAPRLINPPSDPDWRPFAEAALRAIKDCAPVHVPEKHAASYAHWKTATVFFDPHPL